MRDSLFTSIDSTVTREWSGVNGYHVDWCKFCLHLISLNVRHFVIILVTRLKIMASMTLSP
jgi:hypothetical protein